MTAAAPSLVNAPEFTVSELSSALKRTVEDRFGHVRVRGEISGFRGPHSSGHCYFALKDESAKIEAVIWKFAHARMRFKPQEGLEVIATGKLTTYPNSSKYQIVIDSLEPAGVGALMALMEERKKLERDLSDARKKLAMGGGGASNGAASAVREVGNVKLLARAVEGVETKDLKSLVDDGKKQIGSGVVAIVGVTEDGKAGIVVGVTADLTSRFNAVELVRKGSEVLGGKGGGGRPDMAQAGGPDGAKADAALSAIEQAMAGA